LFFGARRLPEIGGSLGKGIREFKDSLKGLDEDVRGEIPPGEGSRDASPPSGQSRERTEDPKA
ncbi:MAG TPA: twin-arginine translocase TatA/TatE family subunit, partial [Gemmatimonadota bacterium]|nr:twin-arginine translocase TatA/TatE family subunit [Gemmatimonadota bacterium]